MNQLTMPTRRMPESLARDAGQGAVEWLIALPVLLLLLGGGLQFGLVFIAKNTLDYANFQAVRAASLDHGSIAAFRRVFLKSQTGPPSTPYQPARSNPWLSL